MDRVLTTTLMVCIVATIPAYAQPRGASQRDSAASARGRIHKLEELTWPQIDALDRDRTMFILPVGMIEEHGPHLPVGADTLAMLFEAERATRRVSRALPEWTIVLMPPLHYGQGGANQIAARLVHPGTYALRQSTLRSLVADLGASVAQNGFRWIFVINGHGAPTHNIAINQACDFVSETLGVTMLHLTGLFRADERIQALGDKVQAKHFSRADLASFGMDVHAGVGETAGMLAVRPDLVGGTYKTLPPQSARTFEELRTISSAPDWQGYFSSPAKATAAYGRDVEAWWVEGFADLILRAVKGENLFLHKRFPDQVPPAVAPALGRALADEQAFEAKLDRWLAQRKIE